MYSDPVQVRQRLGIEDGLPGLSGLGWRHEPVAHAAGRNQ